MTPEISAKTIVENAVAGWQLPSGLIYGRGFADWKPGALQHSIELISFVEDLVGMQQHGIALEIGLDKGGTHLVWKHLYAKVISIDINLSNSVMFASGLVHKPEASKIIVSNSQLPLTTILVAQELKGALVDMLFIDGDYNYNAVESDYLNYEPYVRSGGIVAFHNTIGQQGVKQFVQELTAGTHPVIKRKFAFKAFVGPDRPQGIAYYVKS